VLPFLLHGWTRGVPWTARRGAAALAGLHQLEARLVELICRWARGAARGALIVAAPRAGPGRGSSHQRSRWFLGKVGGRALPKRQGSQRCDAHPSRFNKAYIALSRKVAPSPGHMEASLAEAQRLLGRFFDEFALLAAPQLKSRGATIKLHGAAQHAVAAIKRLGGLVHQSSADGEADFARTKKRWRCVALDAAQWGT
jgi:hypothetical protein